MKIKDLREDIRVRAVHNYYVQKSINTPYDIKDVQKLYETDLRRAFIWFLTPEEHFYWELCNEGLYEIADEHLIGLEKSKTEYMMDGQPIYTEAVPTIKKHNLKPLPTMGPTARTLLGVLIGGVIAVGLLFIQTILNK
jgi:hypothetical protein